MAYNILISISPIIEHNLLPIANMILQAAPFVVLRWFHELNIHMGMYYGILQSLVIMICCLQRIRIFLSSGRITPGIKDVFPYRSTV
jgi:hypothetical protein